MNRHEFETDPELLAERLKERIYASIALLAVFLSMSNDMRHGEAALLIGATAISLWMASIFSVLISRAMVYERHKLTRAEVQHQFVIHAPLLASATTPLILVGLSALNLFTMATAIKISAVWLLAFMAISSILAARKTHASLLRKLVAAGLAFGMGLLIITIKIAVSH